jgi:hypothetical protein
MILAAVLLLGCARSPQDPSESEPSTDPLDFSVSLAGPHALASAPVKLEIAVRSVSDVPVLIDTSCIWIYLQSTNEPAIPFQIIETASTNIYRVPANGELTFHLESRLIHDHVGSHGYSWDEHKPGEYTIRLNYWPHEDTIYQGNSTHFEPKALGEAQLK